MILKNTRCVKIRVWRNQSDVLQEYINYQLYFLEDDKNIISEYRWVYGRHLEDFFPGEVPALSSDGDIRWPGIC